jgi:hypothetical protein
MIWKKREVLARKISRIFGRPQAAGKTGPVIRIAITKFLARCVMVALLADANARIKRIMHVPDQSWKSKR